MRRILAAIRKAFVRDDAQTLEYLAVQRTVYLTDPRMRAALRRRNSKQTKDRA